jgi:Creatinine amidohydrolase
VESQKTTQGFVKTAASLAELRLEQLTSEEIREGIANGMSVVICLVGSIEQHGPHLPCETDCYYGLSGMPWWLPWYDLGVHNTI